MTMERFVALQWIAIIAVIAWLLYLLEPILTPFFIAAILAYICDPWVDRLCAWKIPRTLATLIVMIALFGSLILLVLIILPLLTRESALFMQRLPDLLDALRTRLLPQLQHYLGINLQWDATTLKNFMLSHWQSASGAAANVLPWLG